MAPTKRHAYEAQFKMQAICYAEEHGNRAAAREFKINELEEAGKRASPSQEDEDDFPRKKKRKTKRGNKARWPELEDQLEQWINELQPLDIGVNRAFKVKLRAAWERWMTNGEHSFTKTRRQRRSSYATICEWIVDGWANVSACTVVRAFVKAGIISEEPHGNETDSNLPCLIENLPSCSFRIQNMKTMMDLWMRIDQKITIPGSPKEAVINQILGGAPLQSPEKARAGD
ncbi:uncharacterized protein LOC133397481 [Phycodurus eques]|uniref:uncharacterized protein LOC133397481 n=1 Tax=Phycodurus eques TaxID=693459 RepID=UPI002ACE4B5D|nr:uncharacterized protein LOC133397481 [Phycodurus eques]